MLVIGVSDGARQPLGDARSRVRRAHLALAAIAVTAALVLLWGTFYSSELVQAPVPGQGSYDVTFVESGLRPGATWWISLGDFGVLLYGNEYTFHCPTGVFAFNINPVAGFLPDPSSGSVHVYASPVTVKIKFMPAPIYPLNFIETGLPNGTGWDVTIDNSSVQSNLATNAFNVSNGTYQFWISPVDLSGIQFNPHPNNGTVVIHGAGTNVSTAYEDAGLYSVSFNETGLPGYGWSWSTWIYKENQSLTSETGTSYSTEYWLPNGTYTFKVGAANYTATPSSGTLVIDGAPIEVAVNFTADAQTSLGLHPRTGVRFLHNGPALDPGWVQHRDQASNAKALLANRVSDRVSPGRSPLESRTGEMPRFVRSV